MAGARLLGGLASLHHSEDSPQHHKGREEGAPGLWEGADLCAWLLRSGSNSSAARSYLYQATCAERASCRAGRKAKTVNKN